MKRRDFLVRSVVSMGTGLLATRMYASEQVATPVRTGRLAGASAGSVNCQDTIFVGKNLICLYTNRASDALSVDPNSPSTIAATTTDGNLLWSYPLTKGLYLSLGTHQGSIVLFALNYSPSSGRVSRSAILLLDPANGNVTEAGTYAAAPMVGPFRYAGDSTFFRINHGSGEVWSINNGFVQSLGGIGSPTLAKKFAKSELIAAETMAVVDPVGTSMALVSLNSGAVTDSTISSDVIANNRATSDATTARAMANAGASATNSRMATRIFITAIGGNQGDAVYAVVPQPTQPFGVVSVVKISAAGVGTTLGSIQLNREGRPYFAAKIVISGSEMAVLSQGGDVAWFSLPLS
jgi:hypothetical protein